VKNKFPKIPRVWVPAKCCFPYPPGYAVYNPKKKTILESGCEYEHVMEICARENRLLVAERLGKRKARRRRR